MIDLQTLPTSATGRIARCVPRRDAGGAIVWDVDVAFDIQSEEDAEVVDAFVPGTIKQFRAGMHFSSKGSAKVSGGFEVVKVHFFTLLNHSVAEGHADIRQCSSNVSGDSAVLVVKFRIHGLLPEPASELAYSLDECLNVRVQSHGTRAEVSSEPSFVRSSSWDSMVGKVVVLDDHIGRVVEISDSHVMLDTLCGNIESVSRDDLSIPTVDFEINSNDEDLEIMIKKFELRCEEVGVEANWSDLIDAIGRLYAKGEIQPTADCTWTITDEVIDEALSAYFFTEIAEA